MATPPLCRQCHERPSIPSCARIQRYRCARCRNSTPAAQARLRRYAQSAKRKAVMKRDNAKRLYVGDAYHSRVATVEQAHAINAHIRERVKQHAAQP